MGPFASPCHAAEEKQNHQSQSRRSSRRRQKQKEIRSASKIRDDGIVARLDRIEHMVAQIAGVLWCSGILNTNNHETPASHPDAASVEPPESEQHNSDTDCIGDCLDGAEVLEPSDRCTPSVSSEPIAALPCESSGGPGEPIEIAKLPKKHRRQLNQHVSDASTCVPSDCDGTLYDVSPDIADRSFVELDDTSTVDELIPHPGDASMVPVTVGPNIPAEQTWHEAAHLCFTSQLKNLSSRREVTHVPLCWQLMALSMNDGLVNKFKAWIIEQNGRGE